VVTCAAEDFDTVVETLTFGWHWSLLHYDS